MGLNEFSKFLDMDPNSSSEGSNQDESHSRVRKFIFKMFSKVSKQSKVIWIEIRPEELQTLVLRNGLGFHI